MAFQLTTSRRGRHQNFPRVGHLFCFQLTTSRRGRLISRSVPAVSAIFQLTTSRRGRHLSGTPSHTSFIFQLTTSRRGRRLGPHLPAAPDCFQLTTSRRGRHVDSQNGCMQRALSTHDLTQRSTQRLLQSLIDENLSTHDLTQRSTSGVISAVQRQTSLNPRRHAEVDLGRIQSPKALLHFQLTTSRRGRRRKDIMITFDYIFQLTTSRRGRHQYFTYFMQNFDPISYIFHKNHFK